VCVSARLRILFILLLGAYTGSTLGSTKTQAPALRLYLGFVRLKAHLRWIAHTSPERLDGHRRQPQSSWREAFETFSDVVRHMPVERGIHI
jgi:hypothetical protein